ncbi:MAG: bifunctional 5,10-methylene-tetrahydrofolate dehydrogenase/5,10-methylene-tetrahydrofolate cyclohydrolase, partial [Lachnospiraceae bacterium]|nr:bifunctional 5,10-methylene-tetrahydrofolate dehydrogenase/5,10-methylene-tetrahydrofolate cyclohydrolase [Lachnospiraceae bacterium]
MAELLKGAPVAAAISEELMKRCEELKKKGIIPCAAIVRVGERPDDLAYEKGALKRFENIGIEVRHFVLPTDCTRSELLSVTDTVNSDSSIHGCLMFRPLQDRETEKEACKRLLPEKDIDCMTSGSLGSVFTGSGTGFPPCTAQAVIELCDHYGIGLEGREIAVVGRSLVIGRPVSMLLMQRNATVTMCHTRTADLAGVCRRADIIVAAAGHAGLITSEHVRPGQIVIDVGINVTPEGRLTGDVDSASVEPVVAALTPVPGGVGSITTAVLAKHVISAAQNCA